VVSEKPGLWFGLYSGKSVIAATDPTVERNAVAESVLDLSYEMETPVTLTRAYASKGDVSDENYVTINGVWNAVSYSSLKGNYVSFSENGIAQTFLLSALSREFLVDPNNPQKLAVKYFNDEISLTETFNAQNNSYPINVNWTLSPSKSNISNVTLYLSTFLELSFTFDKAYVPGILNWESPWNKPSYVQEKNEWAIVNFTGKSLTDDYVGIYDDKNQVMYGVKFTELPVWGDVGVLASKQIDAVRFEYQFDNVNVGQTASVSYQLLAFAKTSLPEMKQQTDLKSLFEFKTSAFSIMSRNYIDFIKQFNIEFIVCAKNRFDNNLLGSGQLKIAYSNDGYVICKINNIP
jgi:hypothetical protein